MYVGSLPSSFFLSSPPPSAGASAPPAGTAPAGAAGPAEPTLVKSSLMSLPSRALAKTEVQMGSTSWTLAAPRRVWILSACVEDIYQPNSDSTPMRISPCSLFRPPIYCVSSCPPLFFPQMASPATTTIHPPITSIAHINHIGCRARYVR